MSSFRRKTPASTAAATTNGTSASPIATTALAPRRALSGTKPFLSGQTLVSTGLAQLDAILGGGLLLGTVMLLETPRSDAGAASTALVDDLHRYFCAEGIAAAQCALVVAQDAAGFAAHQLPLELSVAQKALKQQLAAMDVAAHGKPQSSAQSPHQPAEQLTIAWQYGKYRASASSQSPPQQQQQRFCHSFDLSRAMHREMLAANPPVLVDPLDASFATLAASPAALYDALLQRIAAAAAAHPHQVVRVSIRELGSPLFGAVDAAHMAALVSFVRRLRAFASSKPVVCLVSGACASFPAAVINDVRHTSDYALEIKSFMGEQDLLPLELQEYDGLVDIAKLARVHALASYATDARKFGLKRERRKLVIEKFHLPPEGSRSSGGSGGTNNSTSTSNSNNSVGCTTASASGHDLLAF